MLFLKSTDGVGNSNIAMCGIGGIVFWDGRKTDIKTVEGILVSQSHRGPDGKGVWCNDGAALAHNRLAIIDVSAGRQPMLTEDGKYIIVYNGELYNFRELRKELETCGYSFRTNSDTEVMLQSYVHWKRDCLQHFRGMFAFAVWDREERSLFIARDRVGIKPLFYYDGPDFFAFSSEIQGLLSFDDIPRRIDYEAIDLYLHYQYVPAPLTIYSDIHKLLPAHYMAVSAGGAKIDVIPYWDVQFEPDRRRSIDDWLEALDAEIRESVRMHLISDVPFGAFLSGGIDSSTVVSQMSRYLEKPVKTFTIGFDDIPYDESAYAEKVSKDVGSEHHFEIIHPDSFNLLDDLIYKLAAHYGEPFADSSAIPIYFVSKLAGSQVKMVLSGDGGDELFAGYNTYPNILGSSQADNSRWGRLIGRLLRRNRTGTILANAKKAPYPEALYSHGIYYAYFKDEERKKLYRPETAENIYKRGQSGLFSNYFYGSRTKECLSALQYLDIKTYLPGDILTKVDIASMAHSLEVRVPLLDHKVIEFAAHVPAEFKMKVTDNGEVQKKLLLKRYADDLFPPGRFDRPKQGFGVPIDCWFRERLYHDVRERIMLKYGVLHDLFNREALSGLVASPERAGNNSGRIWALLFLQAWAEKFNITGIGA